MEVSDSDKPTSLLCNRISYNCKKFKSIGPKACFLYLLTANIKIGWKCLTVTNLLVYYTTELVTTVKSLKLQAQKHVFRIYSLQILR